MHQFALPVQSAAVPATLTIKRDRSCKATPKHLNTRFLETFIWVAHLRNFSSAAQKLHTTQAAVSNRIATLERDLGVQLFERDLRSVRLTPQGKNALAHAEDIVRRVADFRANVGNKQALRGMISIGTVDTLVYAWIPRLINRMRTEYTNIGVDLTVDTSLNVARQLQNGEIDLALMMGPVAAPDILNEEICSYECTWVAATQVPFPDRTLQFADLAQYPILAYSRGSMPHLAIQRMAAEAGLAPEQLHTYNMNSLATQLHLVISGMCIAVLPMVVIREALALRKIKVLDTATKMPALTFHAVYRSRPDDYITTMVAGMAKEIALEPLPD